MAKEPCPFSQIRQLIELLRSIKQYDLLSSIYRQKLAKIADIVLKFRLICRPYQGQPLQGIYQETYQEIRCRLIDNLPKFIAQIQFTEANSNSQVTETYLLNWVKNLLNTAIKESLTDKRLTDLAKIVQKCNPQSQQRRYAMNELVQCISLSGKLYCSNTVGFAGEFYEILLEEAINKTLLYVVEKIDTFDPQRGKLMTWVNYRLNRNLYEVRREFDDPYVAKLLRNQRKQAYTLKSLAFDYFWLLQKIILLKQAKAENLLPKIIPIFLDLLFCQLSYQSLDQQALVTLHLANLWENKIGQAENHNRNKAKGLIDYIAEDPENIFSRCHIRGRKDANFREIALLKNRQGLKWQEIANKFKIRISTLSDFYQRSLEKFKPNFEDFLQ